MVQNKKIGGALALVVGLLGFGASGAASALPEMDVGTAPPIVAQDSANTLDGAVAAPEDEDALNTAT